MRMLKWISGNTLKDRIQSEGIWQKIGEAPIDEKMKESNLRWFGHICKGEGLMLQQKRVSLSKLREWIKKEEE